MQPIDGRPQQITRGLLGLGALSSGRERLRRAREEVATGAISGAVGTFANIDPAVEAHVCAKLGLKPEPISTQVIPRDRHAMFFAVLGVIASSVERLATEIRHLQRTEVLEAEEYFSPGQKGSSAMPHKRNPVLTENLTGLARQAGVVFEPPSGHGYHEGRDEPPDILATGLALDTFADLGLEHDLLSGYWASGPAAGPSLLLTYLGSTFQPTPGWGLAISLLFGLLSSTLLTVLVIPAIYRIAKT